MRPDGSDVRRLTRNQVNDTVPSVSRDGRRIAFVRQAPRGPMEIWIMTADGAAPRRLASARSLSSPT
jgi:Tol biopolymer transport system component